MNIRKTRIAEHGRNLANFLFPKAMKKRRSQKMYERLAKILHSENGIKNALFYLAIPPSWYECVAANLNKAGMVVESEGFRRIVVEKPFGMDLDSAESLNGSMQQLPFPSSMPRTISDCSSCRINPSDQPGELRGTDG